MTFNTDPAYSLPPQGRALAHRTALEPAHTTPVGAPCSRRDAAAGTAMLVLATVASTSWSGSLPHVPGSTWYEAAAAMKRMAVGWGDQAYGAVLVLDGQLVGEGPSRVVQNRDADAHAEREAIRDAQRRLGKAALPGAVLYSTSRPCRRCEAAAARAKVSRMYFGPQLVDAGAPREAQE